MDFYPEAAGIAAIAREKWWLGDDCPFGKVTLQGRTAVSFGEGKTSGQLGVATPPPRENLGSFGVVPLPRIPVTTRTITVLVGDPCKPSFATVAGREDNPRDPESIVGGKGPQGWPGIHRIKGLVD